MICNCTKQCIKHKCRSLIFVEQITVVLDVANVDFWSTIGIAGGVLVRF